MGIVAFNWAEGNNNQLTLLMNRDNWETRVISGASWNGDGQILSGRCAENGGTWFGISRRGRVAFLVSAELLLDRIRQNGGTELYPIQFLEGNMTPQDFGNYVASHRGQVLSYSLIVADMALNSMVHVRKFLDEEVKIEIVGSGVHTLSPIEGLDAATTRHLRLRNHFNRMIADLGNNNQPTPEEIAGGFMYNADGGEGAVFRDFMTMEHPKLGMQLFGTTSTTALVVERTGRARLFERYRHNGAWPTHDFDFNIQ